MPGKRNPKSAPVLQPAMVRGPSRKDYEAQLLNNHLRDIARKAIRAQAEMKFADENYNNTPSNTGIMKVILNPAQGVTENQRIGDQIRLQKLELRININGANLHICRVILFYWKPNVTVFAPTPGYILNGAYSGTTYFAQSPYSRDYSKEYSIIYDKTFSQDTTKTKILTLKKKLKNHVVNFVNGSATDCEGALYMLTVVDGVLTLNTNYVTTRLWFTDL